MLPDMDEDEVADVLYDTAARPSELLRFRLKLAYKVVPQFVS
jgi:hypothetical protein